MRGRLVSPVVVGLALAFWVPGSTPSAFGADEPTLTTEQTEHFLKNAEVIQGRPVGKGITRPWRLTLSDGTVTHDAALNVVDKRSNIERFEDGTFELNFVDSYRFNIAAYRLAELLDLKAFVPVTVERRWNGKVGALSWWVDDAMDEGERLRQKLRPPDVQAWNRQLYRVRLFNNLVYDTDRNLGNMLITTEWQCWVIDFTRAFRKWRKLPAQSDLEMIEGTVLARLRDVTLDITLERTNPHLLKNEVEALLERRDLIVKHFDTLIADRGQGAVVY